MALSCFAHSAVHGFASAMGVMHALTARSHPSIVISMNPKVRARIKQRSHGVCERCGIAMATVIHHRRRRSQGGNDDEDNLMALCSPCHVGIHDHPEDSYQRGYLIRGVQNVRKGLGYTHVETDG